MKKDLATTSDSDILSLSLKDPKIFGQIVDRYEEPFIRKAISIIKNEDDAKDIVQEAFTKIYLHAGKFERRAGASFNSWAYKILLNTCYTHYKRHKKERLNVELDEAVDYSHEEAEEESDVERFLLVLSKIPRSCAKLLRLIMEGKSYKDISQLEGISENTLRVKIHRAKASFKKALAQNPNL
jgi:RNA polymerase sigma-70 factor (ECF subfamily)